MIEKYVPKKIIALVKRVLGTPVFQRIIKNASYLLSATGITMVLAIIQGIFVFRIISPEDWGLLGAIFTFTTAANKITGFRINELVVRYMRLFIEEGEQNKAAAIYKLASLLETFSASLTFISIWVLSSWGAEFFGKDVATQPLWIIYGTVVLINSTFDSSRGLLQVFTRFQTIAATNIIKSCSTLALAIYWYFNNGGLNEILLLYMGGKLVDAIGKTSAAIWTANQEWGSGWWSSSPLRILKADLKSIFTFAFSTNFSDTISLVAKDSETLWVSAFLGTEAAGYYYFATGLIGKIKLPISPLALTTYPELAREVANKKWESVKDTLIRSSRLAGVYTLPIVLFFMVLGKPAIELLYEENFLPAYPILMILLIGMTFDNIFFWNRVALLALNRPVYPTIVNFIGMIIKVSLIFILVEQYQAYAFASLLSFYYIFTVGFAVLGVRSELNKKMSVSEAA